MSEWPKKRLGELAHTYAGGTPSRAVDEFYGGNIAWVKSTELNQSAIYDTPEFITEAGLKGSNCKMVPENTVLIAMYGATAGQVAQLKIRAATNQAVLAIVCGEELDSEFAYYVLVNKRAEVLYLAQGSGQPNLSKDLIDKTYVSLPSLAQQQKIATILTTVDQLIEKTQTLIEKYTTIKQGMMADLFTRGIDLTPGPDGRPESNPNYGQLRPPREQAPELYKETELGWVPKEWDVKPISDCVVQVVGGASIKTYEFSSEGVGVIAKSDVTTSKSIDVSFRSQFVSTSDATKYARFMVDNEFVIVSLRDLVPSGPTVGMAARFAGEGRYLLAQGTYGFYFNREVLIPDIFVEYSRQPWFRSKIRGMVVGSTQVHVRSSEYVGLPVPAPSISEQQEILQRIAAIDSIVENNNRQLDKYRLIKTGLMQDLLTGKVEVQGV